MLFGYLYFFFGWLPRQILSAFRKELTPILLKLFHKIAEEGTLPNSYYEATITLITKTKQRHYTHTHTHTHTQKQRPISLMNIDTKIFNTILANQIQ